jgi:hypothetical protein
VYSTFEVHVIKHADDTEVITGLPLDEARLIAANERGVVVERVHYDLPDSVDRAHDLQPAQHR